MTIFDYVPAARRRMRAKMAMAANSAIAKAISIMKPTIMMVKSTWDFWSFDSSSKRQHHSLTHCVLSRSWRI